MTTLLPIEALDDFVLGGGGLVCYFRSAVLSLIFSFSLTNPSAGFACALPGVPAIVCLR